METITREKREMNSLAECMNVLTLEGFTRQFQAVNSGLMELSSGTIYPPERVKVLNFYRFEGESDPADNSILYAIETDDGVRGTLVDAYGPYADSKVADFMKKVEEIYKRTDSRTPL